MLMLLDTPDSRYGPDPGRDGRGRPRLRMRTVVLLGGGAVSLYLARFVPMLPELLLMVGAFVASLGAMFSSWRTGRRPPSEEP